MSRKTSNFVLGLFVTVGILIGVGIIVWLGASRYFQKGPVYVTYFDESVQGLEVDSSVKYRGVDVGRVEKIGVAPDYKLIEIVMRIDLEGDLERDIVAQLKTAGITGIVFIELDRRQPGDADLTPRIDFAAEYPIISSRPSELKKILFGLDDIIEKVKQIDFKGISDQLTTTIKALETFVAGKRMDTIMARLESTVVKLDAVVGAVDTLAKGRLDNVLSEAGAALTEARAVIADVKDEVYSLNLAGAGKSVNRLVEGVEKKTGAVAADIRITGENLRRASEALEMLLERLNANPSDLIFSRPPPAGRTR